MSEWQEIERAVIEEVLTQMPAGVVIAEAPSGRIIFVNGQAQQWTERSRGRARAPNRARATKLEDAGAFQIFHPDGRPYEMEEWPLMRSIRDGKEVRNEEFVYPLTDGTGLLLRCNSSPVYDDEGRIVAGVLVAQGITEQKRAEEERAYHAHLLENIHDAVTATDERYVITAWNKGAEQMFGLRADEALGRRVYELIPTDYGDEQLAEALRELTETGRRRSEGLRYRKDGTPFYAEALTIALRGEQESQITGYLGIHRDITERKRAQEKTRFQAELLDAVGQAVIATDPEGKVLYWNRAAEVLYGWSAEEVMGRSVGEFGVTEDLQGRLAEIMEELRAGRTWSGEFTVLRKDGSTVPVLATDTPVYDERGNLSGIIGVSADITERVRAEEEIENRTHQQAVVAELGLRALAENDLQSLLDEAAASVTQTLDIEYSKVMELLPGGEELLLRTGVGWEEGLVGEVRELAGEGSEAGYTLRSDEPVIMEDLSTEERFSSTSLLAEHGVVSGLSVVIHGHEWPFGALCAHTASRRDFSEDDINFLQAVANVLATAIERRQAQQKLEEVTEAERSRLARDLHDEALQDLSGALVDAQRLKAISTDAEASRLSERLLATLDRVGPQLRGAIYDLRLEREQDRPFSELLVELVELQRTIASNLQIALDTQDGILEGALGETGSEILRIVGEALTNARRHSEAENVWVRVGVSHGTLFAEVEDDGRGLGPTQEGSTPPAAATTTGGGVGIQAMRERANHLGGDLRTESERGKGTKVRLELVLQRELEEPEEQQEEEVRILLVDDHASIREALASTLEEVEGFEVVGQAGSMAEAQRILAQESADMAVIDLGLPDGYGGDLIKEMHEKNPRAQALVLSATLDRAQIARVVERGAAGVLNKTAHLDEVVRAIRRLRAGETLMPLEEVVELLRFASARRDEEYEARQAIESLTPREIEVLQALAEGLDSRQIAERLHISLRTERNHITSILAKLGVHSQLQALVLAQRHGVVEIR